MEDPRPHPVHHFPSFASPSSTGHGHGFSLTSMTPPPSPEPSRASTSYSVSSISGPPIFNAANQLKAKERNKSIGGYAYGLEVEQDGSIADAAAKVVDGLDEVGFIASNIE